MSSSRLDSRTEIDAPADETLPEEVFSGARGTWLAASGLFVALLVLWELLCRLLDIAPHLLPAPSAIGIELYRNFGVLLDHLVVTTVEVVSGFLIATVIGVALAILVDRSEWLRTIIHPYVIVLQATPKVALAPFLVIWFGFGISSKIAMAALITFFPIFVNSISGFSAIPPRLLELMAVMRASRRQVLWKVKLPHALPYIFAGLEIGILLSLIGAIVGEFVSANAGLGYLVATYNFQLQTASAFAALVMLVLLGLVSYLIILVAKRRIVFWLGKV